MVFICFQYDFMYKKSMFKTTKTYFHHTGPKHMLQYVLGHMKTNVAIFPVYQA